MKLQLSILFTMLIISGLSAQKSEAYAQHIKAAKAAYKTNDFKKSIKNYKKALKISQSDSNDVLQLGKAYVRLGKSKKATKWLTKAIAIDDEITCTKIKFDKQFDALKANEKCWAKIEQLCAENSKPTNTNPSTDRNPLLGKWTLKSIKYYPQDEIVIPQKDYWVEFTDTKINFNKEVNTCLTNYQLLGRDRLQIEAAVGCTKKCCDKDISDKLTYAQATSYTISDKKMTLKTPDRVFEFTKR